MGRKRRHISHLWLCQCAKHRKHLQIQCIFPWYYPEHPALVELFIISSSSCYTSALSLLPSTHTQTYLPNTKPTITKVNCDFFFHNYLWIILASGVKGVGGEIGHATFSFNRKCWDAHYCFLCFGFHQRATDVAWNYLTWDWVCEHICISKIQYSLQCTAVMSFLLCSAFCFLSFKVIMVTMNQRKILQKKVQHYPQLQFPFKKQYC